MCFTKKNRSISLNIRKKYDKLNLKIHIYFYRKSVKKLNTKTSKLTIVTMSLFKRTYSYKTNLLTTESTMVNQMDVRFLLGNIFQEG